MDKNISPNLVEAIKFAKTVGAKVMGVVGRDGGYTAQSCRRLLYHSDREPGNGHTAFGSLPSSGLAPARLASEAQNPSDQVGISGARMKRAVFLDRDGVLNRAIVRDGKPYPPRSVAELEILPDVGNALAALHAAGLLLIVVTNQPDVARGATTRDEVEKAQRRTRRGPADRRVPNLLSRQRRRLRLPQTEPGALLAAAVRARH